jgi:undecaprenyl-diphosphatase
VSTGSGPGTPRSVSLLLVRGSAVLLGGFLVLAGLVWTGNNRLSGYDARWSARAYAFTLDRGWCLTLAHGATWLGSGLVVVVLTGAATLLCLIGRRWLLAWWLVATVAGSALLNSLLKAGLDKARPSSAGSLTTAHGFAVPSGHTQAATVTYVAVVLVAGGRAGVVVGRLRPAAVAVVTAVVAAVGLSRVLLGAHWPSDVAGGWLLGSAWVMAATVVLLRGGGRRYAAPSEGLPRWRNRRS